MPIDIEESNPNVKYVVEWNIGEILHKKLISPIGAFCLLGTPYSWRFAYY